MLTALGQPSPKRKLIQQLFDLYSHLPFVLLGDSGQHDPEIYVELARTNPRRALAIYIRDISGGTDKARVQEVNLLAAEMDHLGVAMLLSPRTADFAAHAAAQGLISPIQSAEEEAEEEAPKEAAE